MLEFHNSVRVPSKDFFGMDGHEEKKLFLNADKLINVSFYQIFFKKMHQAINQTL